MNNIGVPILLIVVYGIYNYMNKTNTELNHNNAGAESSIVVTPKGASCDVFELKNELNYKLLEINKLISEQKEITQGLKAKESLLLQREFHDNKLISEKQQPQILTEIPTIASVPILDNVEVRDRRVLDDPLYPTYGRTERPLFDMLMKNRQSGLFNMPTRGSPDTPRAMGLAKNDTTGEIYYLMGKQSYSGSNKGEFYLVSTDKNNNLKIDLTDRSGKQIIRNYWDIPEKLAINDGIFEGNTFTVQEIKKPDLYSNQY